MKIFNFFQLSELLERIEHQDKELNDKNNLIDHLSSAKKK